MFRRFVSKLYWRSFDKEPSQVNWSSPIKRKLYNILDRIHAKRLTPSRLSFRHCSTLKHSFSMPLRHKFARKHTSLTIIILTCSKIPPYLSDCKSNQSKHLYSRSYPINDSNYKKNKNRDTPSGFYPLYENPQLAIPASAKLQPLIYLVLKRVIITFI